ncbi:MULTISPECIES: DUF305 domain-containing protein [Pseudofrankia]|uniref:DUF305 domain-containing protein n=1 Tax=Pseudofrankia TaxID=2994363 RepID=UPI000234BE7C|nr:MULTISPECIES: DUF305 domain-containing protein [Pseudofrankia]OHV30153.1 DUF305 domain-containing protein [Pseudofrankia sp. EUN1h]
MKRLVMLLGAVLAAVVLAACGGASTGASAGSGGSMSSMGTTASEDHNAADVAFAQGMIPHHQQAIEMADLAPTRASSPDVKALAQKIREAQAPEITTMTGWLTSWGEPTAAPSASGGMDMDHGDMSSMPMATPSASMGGMMSEADMSMLENASGRGFDRMFLTMMIQHHRGAIAMATTEQRDGDYGPAKQLAGAIVTNQTAEITTMQTLLQKI